MQQVREAALRASKWKQRCLDLREELQEAKGARAALEGALNVSFVLPSSTVCLRVHGSMLRASRHEALRFWREPCSAADV